MTIEKYLTISEATYRWKLSNYQINKVLKNNSLVNRYSKIGLLKGVHVPPLKKPVWIISEEFMVAEFGSEFGSEEEESKKTEKTIPKINYTHRYFNS